MTGVLKMPLLVAKAQGRPPRYRPWMGLEAVLRLSRRISGQGDFAWTGTS
jgi:hypothetical protein